MMSPPPFRFKVTACGSRAWKEDMTTLHEVAGLGGALEVAAEHYLTTLIA